MSARLPVVSTVVAAYQDVFADLPATLRAMALIAALLVLVVEVPMLFLSDYVTRNLEPAAPAASWEDALEPEAEKPAMPEDGAPSGADEAVQPSESLTTRAPLVVLAAMILSAIQMLILFRFTLAWYRQLLSGEGRGRVIPFRFGKPEIRLVWTSIKVGFVFLPVIFITSAVLAYAGSPEGGGDVSGLWPLLLAMVAVLLFLQARMALAYPATVMEATEAPVRQSWNLTRRQSLGLILGNLLSILPGIAGLMLVFWGLSWIFSFVLPEPEPGQAAAPILLAGHLVMKITGVFGMLLLVATLSAFHAHAYAYLMRSSSPASSS